MGCQWRGGGKGACLRVVSLPAVVGQAGCCRHGRRGLPIGPPFGGARRSRRRICRPACVGPGLRRLLREPLAQSPAPCAKKEELRTVSETRPNPQCGTRKHAHPLARSIEGRRQVSCPHAPSACAPPAASGAADVDGPGSLASGGPRRGPKSSLFSGTSISQLRYQTNSSCRWCAARGASEPQEARGGLSPLQARRRKCPQYSGGGTGKHRLAGHSPPWPDPASCSPSRAVAAAALRPGPRGYALSLAERGRRGAARGPRC